MEVDMVANMVANMAADKKIVDMELDMVADIWPSVHLLSFASLFIDHRTLCEF